MSKESELRDQAAIMRRLARTLGVASLRADLLELADQCETLARSAARHDAPKRRRRAWYRLDVYTGDGGLLGREQFKADSLEAAVELATRVQPALAAEADSFELWRDGRLVATGPDEPGRRVRRDIEEQAIRLEEHMQASRARIAASRARVGALTTTRSEASSRKRD
jgi:hypothetical protein